MATRRRPMTARHVALGVLLLHLVAPPAAWAYLDPGSGSLLIQVLVATALGMIVGVKRIWFTITEFVRRLFRRDR
jgi:hypothetical protein